MADFAWSPIHHANGVVKIGEKVTRNDLGIEKDEYDALKEAGAIRERPYPKDVGPNESVRERNVRKLADTIREAGESVEGINIGELQEENQPAETQEVTRPR